MDQSSIMDNYHRSSSSRISNSDADYMPSTSTSHMQTNDKEEYGNKTIQGIPLAMRQENHHGNYVVHYTKKYRSTTDRNNVAGPSQILRYTVTENRKSPETTEIGMTELCSKVGLPTNVIQFWSQKENQIHSSDSMKMACSNGLPRVVGLEVKLEQPEDKESFCQDTEFTKVDQIDGMTRTANQREEKEKDNTEQEEHVKKGSQLCHPATKQILLSAYAEDPSPPETSSDRMSSLCAATGLGAYAIRYWFKFKLRQSQAPVRTHIRKRRRSPEHTEIFPTATRTHTKPPKAPEQAKCKLATFSTSTLSGIMKRRKSTELTKLKRRSFPTPTQIQKKPRKTLEQTTTLLAEFAKDPRVPIEGTVRMANLQATTGLGTKSILNWFHNQKRVCKDVKQQDRTTRNQQIKKILLESFARDASTPRVHSDRMRELCSATKLSTAVIQVWFNRKQKKQRENTTVIRKRTKTETPPKNRGVAGSDRISVTRDVTTMEQVISVDHGLEQNAVTIPDQTAAGKDDITVFEQENISELTIVGDQITGDLNDHEEHKPVVVVEQPTMIVDQADSVTREESLNTSIDGQQATMAYESAGDINEESLSFKEVTENIDSEVDVQEPEQIVTGDRDHGNHLGEKFVSKEQASSSTSSENFDEDATIPYVEPVRSDMENTEQKHQQIASELTTRFTENEKSEDSSKDRKVVTKQGRKNQNKTVRRQPARRSSFLDDEDASSSSSSSDDDSSDSDYVCSDRELYRQKSDAEDDEKENKKGNDEVDEGTFCQPSTSYVFESDDEEDDLDYINMYLEGNETGVQILREAFAKYPRCPDATDLRMSELCEKTNMPANVIQYWFRTEKTKGRQRRSLSQPATCAPEMDGANADIIDDLTSNKENNDSTQKEKIDRSFTETQPDTVNDVVEEENSDNSADGEKKNEEPTTTEKEIKQKEQKAGGNTVVRKREREEKTPQQLKILKEEFHKDPSRPKKDTPRLAALTSATGLTGSSVREWFYHRQKAEEKWKARKGETPADKEKWEKNKKIMLECYRIDSSIPKSTSDRMSELCSATGLDYKIIKRWFANRQKGDRHRAERMAKESSAAPNNGTDTQKTDSANAQMNGNTGVIINEDVVGINNKEQVKEVSNQTVPVTSVSSETTPGDNNVVGGPVQANEVVINTVEWENQGKVLLAAFNAFKATPRNEGSCLSVLSTTTGFHEKQIKDWFNRHPILLAALKTDPTIPEMGGDRLKELCTATSMKPEDIRNWFIHHPNRTKEVVTLCDADVDVKPEAQETSEKNDYCEVVDNGSQEDHRIEPELIVLDDDDDDVQEVIVDQTPAAGNVVEDVPLDRSSPDIEIVEFISHNRVSPEQILKKDSSPIPVRQKTPPLQLPVKEKVKKCAICDLPCAATSMAVVSPIEAKNLDTYFGSPLLHILTYTRAVKVCMAHILENREYLKKMNREKQ